MIKQISWTMVAVGGVMLTAPNAWADNALGGSSGNFTRNGNVSVRERPRPGLEATGAHLGGFTLFPRLTVSATRDDNIYAAQNAPTSDTIVQIAPEVLLQSNWARHALGLYARAFVNRYVDHTSENSNSYTFGGTGRLDIARASSLSGNASWGRFIEPRTAPTAPTAAAKPTEYNLAQAGLSGLTELNRMRFGGGFTFNNYKFLNGVTTSGAPLLENYRSRDEWTESAHVDYAVSPSTSVFVTGAVDQRNYRLRPPAVAFDQSSHGYNIQAGTNFDITHLIRGQVQAGWLSESYSDTRYKTTNGLALSAAVDWFPTELTTVNFTASRTIEEATVVGASGFLATNLGVRVDHELLRNLILSAQGGYGYDSYRNVDRTDKLPSAAVSATYMVNRNVGLTFSYKYSRLDSSGAAKNPSYTDNNISASLTLQY